MYPPLGRLGDVDLSEFAGAGTQTVAGAPGPSHGRARTRRSGFRPTAHALKWVQRKLMPRQDFASSFAQSDGPYCKHKNCQVENKSYDENDLAGDQSHRSPLQEQLKSVGRDGMQIDFQVPT